MLEIISANALLAAIGAVLILSGLDVAGWIAIGWAIGGSLLAPWVTSIPRSEDDEAE